MKATPEQLYQLFSERQSDRSYQERPVPLEVLERIVEHSLLAPSATNQQPWSLVLVYHPQEVQKVADAALSGLYGGVNKFIRKAPAFLLVVAERQSLLARVGTAFTDTLYTPYDLGILVAHLVLAAEAEGVGSCILGWLNGKALQKQLQIPNSKKVVMAIALGYPAGEKRTKKRKPLSQVLHYGKW